ncbi:ComEA family DNA-binding protein [Pseudomonas sp. BN102]|uniref:ComEA family DNA-binding protein n=1 Tax=Pseudomonas sp. BN102 TaxID=2567886 RepID=UPI0024566DA4|nr:ComEA family DNA-binding protein [Pseudomonas sp. BN102]MDH4607323.1 ComEA family DNA-binding protein [Pseudomonas sp. BN102]
MLRIRIASLFLVLCSLFFGFTQTAVAAKTEAAAAATSAARQTGKLNINSADAAAFQSELVGIGETKAKAIMQYREENGPFSSVDDLLEVKGIGAKTLEKNREKLSVE